jgi:hypothetical protein
MQVPPQENCCCTKNAKCAWGILCFSILVCIAIGVGVGIAEAMPNIPHWKDHEMTVAGSDLDNG